MRSIKIRLLIGLLLLIVTDPHYPVFAQVLTPENNNHVGLIPLYASYDTNYQFGAGNSGAIGASQPLISMINMRKIVPIIFESSINSRSVCIGEQVLARLKEDLYYGRKLVAHQNSLLKGTVVSVRSARTLNDSLWQKDDWLKSNSAIGIEFNELVIDQWRSIALLGRPVHQESFRRGMDGYTYGIGVDNQGRIFEGGRSLTKGQKDSYNVLRVATAAPVPGGLIINIIAAPVVMTAVGAASPDLAFNKPVDRNLSYRRLRGAAYGFVTNLPGAFFVQAIVQKGNDVVITNGDELMVDLAISNSTNSLSKNIGADSNEGATTMLDVKAQVVDTSAPSKIRLLPAVFSSRPENTKELVLKDFIPHTN